LHAVVVAVNAAHPGRAEDIDGELAERAVETRPEELVDRGRRTHGARLHQRQRPQGVIAHDAQRRPRFGQALPHDRIGGDPARTREVGDLAELVLEAQLLSERRGAPFERERAHRDPPAPVHFADDVLGRGAGPIEERLVELAVPGDLDDRADLDPRLVHRHQEIRQPFVLRRIAVGAAEDEDPLRPVRQRSPDLLSLHDPLVAVALGARLDVGQIGARVRLGVALAPDLGAPEDPRKERPLLVVAAEVDDRRSEESLADDADTPRSTRARVLLEEDHLLEQGRAATAVLGRPAEPDPAVAAELLLPCPALVEELVLVARSAPPPHLGERTVEAIREPRARVRAEAFLFGGETEVQARGPYLVTIRP
jgi:hypothetical protein